MSEDLAWIFLPVYGPTSPWKYGLIWCRYEGWVNGPYHGGIIDVEGVVE